MTVHSEKRRRRVAVLGFGIGGTRAVAPVITIAACALSIGGLLSSALLVDNETNPNNSFSTGTIDLTLNPTATRFSVTNMMPGDVYVAPITVGNAGNQQLRYAMLSTTTEDPLAAQLQMSIRALAGTTTTGCDSAGFGTFGSTLTPSYTAGVLGSTGGTMVIGDAAQGADTGDRTLNGAASEVLCIRVELPSSVTAPAAASTSADFLFNAEQTASNP